MQSFTIRFIVALVILVTGCSISVCQHTDSSSSTEEPKQRVVSAKPFMRAQSGKSVPDGWRKIDAEGLFTFYLPSDMKQADVMGIEDFQQEYTNGTLAVNFVHDPSDFLAYEAREEEYSKGV